MAQARRELTLSQVYDALEELRRQDITVDDRRALVDDLTVYMRRRESQHALQQLLDQVAEGLTSAESVSTELGRWRPAFERLVATETGRLELEARHAANGIEVRRGLAAWAMSALTPQTVLILIAIAAAATGLSITLPGGVQVSGAP